MRILGIIPARGGSKGVPGKNIKSLHGKPLLYYTAKIALDCESLDTVIVSTDDPAIASVAKEIGVETPFLRPENLAQDDTPTIDVISHALKWYAGRNRIFDAVCILQVTCPFRTLKFLNGAILKFKQSGCDSLISVRKVPHEYNPHWTFEKTSDEKLQIATGESKIIPRRQDLPDAFHRDGSIYIAKSTVVLEQNSLFGESVSYIESAEESYVNIDTAADWEKAEKIAAQLYGA